MKVVNSAGQVKQQGAGGGGATFYGGLSTLGNTSGNTGVVSGQLVLAGGANVTLSGSTNGASATVTISGGAGGGGLNVSAGTTSNNLSTLVFSNSNGVSFGLDGSTLTATVQTNYLTSQSNQALSAANGSFAFQTAQFHNSNGLSWSTTTGSGIVASHDGLTSQSNQALSGQNGSFTFQTASFSNANGISFGTSAGPAITASHNALTSQSNQAFSAQGGSSAFQTLVFTNSNGISFSNTNGSVWGSHNAITSQSNQQMTLFATGNTTQSSTGTTNASSLVFRGEGVASVGITNGSVVVSVPAGGGGGFTAGMSTGGNTSGTTGLVSNQVVFVGGNNVTLSQSVNGQSATITISAGAGGGGGWTNTIWRNPGQISAAGTVVGNSLVSFQPFILEAPVQFSNFRCAASFNVATTTNTSSAYVDVSISGVFYTRNASTLSSLHSFSNSLTVTWNSNNSQTVTGVHGITATVVETTFTAGEYWLALHLSTNNTSTGGTATTALANSISMILASSIGSAANLLKPWGGQSANSLGLIPGQGILSTGVTRGTVGLSDIVATGTRGFLAPVYFELRNATWQS